MNEELHDPSNAISPAPPAEPAVSSTRRDYGCKLCGKPFTCNNGQWFTTCDCARERPEELAAAQAEWDRSRPTSAPPPTEPAEATGEANPSEGRRPATTAAEPYRCNICGGVVKFDGTHPSENNWGGRKSV